ncbi:MAG: substrate-binding domain-containing protein [Cetobacterium sp.]
MKKFLIIVVLLAATKIYCKDLLMGTTTSLDDTGFLTEISKVLKADSGIELKWIAKGTGEALELGKRGDVDILFTHDPSREEKFIKDGYGTKRHPLMNNYFVFVTNKEKDIAAYPKSSVELLEKIKKENLIFVSRGDNSGTHSKERSLWKMAQIETDFKNYKEAGLGMAKTLNLTSELKGITLSDKGTYLKVKNKFGLEEIPLNEKESLKNIYSILELSNVDSSKKEDIEKFLKFMESKKAMKIIENYGKTEFKEPLFNVEK